MPFLVRFDSPTDAVLCGLTVQEVLRRHNAAADAKQRLEVRVAINSGDVELTENDIYGDAVNIAARLEGVAEPGEVWFTESVYLAMNRREAPAAEIGERTFKGIPYPIRVYRAELPSDTDFAQRLNVGVELTEGGSVIQGLHQSSSPRIGNGAGPGSQDRLGCGRLGRRRDRGHLLRDPPVGGRDRDRQCARGVVEGPSHPRARIPRALTSRRVTMTRRALSRSTRPRPTSRRCATP